MDYINIKTAAKYLSIQKGFEWKDIPQFAIITGVNGAGKTHLLSVMKDEKQIDVVDSLGVVKRLILSSSVKNDLNIDGLIKYKNNTTKRLAQRKQYIESIKNYNNAITQTELEKAKTYDKIRLQQLDNQIESYQQQITHCTRGINNLFTYAYDEELSKLLSTLGKKEIEEISDDEIREYASPYFNTLTEIEDFEKFIQQENDLYKTKLSFLMDEKKFEEAKELSEQEKSYQAINRLFKKYGFDYYEMMNPFTKDGARNGQILFVGKNGEEVQYGSLSSGERMIVKFIIWAMATDIRGNRINTMLLDEPDAHLHPSMCKMMVEILQEISMPKEHGGSGIRVIITTHSPSTVAFAPAGTLYVMEKDENNDRIIKQTSTEEAVRILSDGIFTYEKAIKQFTLIASSSKNNILFVEGKTDINHLNKAIEILGYNLDLDIFELHDAGALSNFIRSTPARLCGGKKLIALFDCDYEGRNSFKSINGDMIMDNIKRLTAVQCEKMSFAITLQAPEKLDKYCPIEFLYPFEYLKPKKILKKLDFREYKKSFKGANPKDDKELNDEYEKETFLRPYKVNDDEKNRFSESIKTETDDAIFKNFGPTIELIAKIINYKDDEYGR